MTEADAWKTQVDSDFAAANAVFNQNDESTYCQAIAKYQQVVEKSINCMDASLRQYGLLVEHERVRAEHYPERMINRLVRLPQSSNREIADRLNRIFSRLLPDIHDLCDLAPKLPLRGELYQRNTEYPFQLPNGDWTAPAAEKSFRKENVQRFERLARQLRTEAERITVALQL